MKYKLKKDLPFAKAGAEVRKDDYLDSDSQTCFACGVYRFWVHKDVMGEWLEEVKPREFWIADYYNYQGKVFYSKESAELSSNSNLKEVIKVREELQ